MREVPEKVQVWDIRIHICTYHTHTTTIHRPHIFSHIHHTCITLSTHITPHTFATHIYTMHTFHTQYTQTQHTFHMHRPHLHRYQILTHISHTYHFPHSHIYYTIHMHIYTTHFPCIYISHNIPHIYDTPHTSIHIQYVLHLKACSLHFMGSAERPVCLHHPPASLL